MFLKVYISYSFRALDHPKSLSNIFIDTLINIYPRWNIQSLKCFILQVRNLILSYQHLNLSRSSVLRYAHTSEFQKMWLFLYWASLSSFSAHICNGIHSPSFTCSAFGLKLSPMLLMLEVARSIRHGIRSALFLAILSAKKYVVPLHTNNGLNRFGHLRNTSSYFGIKAINNRRVRYNENQIGVHFRSVLAGPGAFSAKCGLVRRTGEYSSLTKLPPKMYLHWGDRSLHVSTT